jgi:hypothetical protein
MTTPRQNLLRTYRREEPEWVPVVTLADGYNRPVHMPASYYDDIKGMSPSRALARYFDLDVLDRVGGYSEHYRNVEYTKTTEGKLEVERWETPYGVLTLRALPTEYYLGEGEPPLTSLARVEYPIKSVDDLRAFAYIYENLEYEFHTDQVAMQVAAVGDSGLVTVNAPPSPLGMCVRVYAGTQTLGFLYKDYLHELRDMLAAVGESYLRCYRGIAKLPCDGTINYDDTTTHAISPTMFRELEVPFLNQSADILHGAGKVCIHHACGHVQHLLADFRATRIDGFDGPAAPPVGNTTVARARAGLGDGIVIMPFTEEYAMKSGDPQTVRGSIRSMFEGAASPRSLVIDIVAPPGGAVESLWLAVDEAKKLSRTYF